MYKLNYNSYVINEFKTRRTMIFRIESELFNFFFLRLRLCLESSEMYLELIGYRKKNIRGFEHDKIKTVCIRQ